MSLALGLELRGNCPNPGVSTSSYSLQMQILGLREKSTTVILTWEAASPSPIG